MKNANLIFASMLIAVSCSKIKELDQRTVNMEQATSEMSKTTDQMKDTTGNMYNQVRSKEARDTRNKEFAIITNKDRSIGEKFTAAGVYYKSFEFQLWSAAGFDDNHARIALYEEAAREFTQTLSDVWNDINIEKMNPTSLGKKDVSETAFYALAATVHYNHHYQEQLTANNKKIERKSLYDIIKIALLKDQNNEDQALYEKLLLAGPNKDMVIDLIKARVDMLSTLALKNLSDKSNMTLSQKTKGLIFKLSGGRLGNIDLPLTISNSNDATKSLTITYLDGAFKAKQFLADIGIKYELQKTLKSAFKKINQSKDLTIAGEGLEKRTEIKNLVEKLLE